MTQSKEMESTATNLRIRTEICSGVEIEEKEEHNERISTSAQMVAMVREHGMYFVLCDGFELKKTKHMKIYVCPQLIFNGFYCFTIISCHFLFT